jgi:two-component system, LuxR family, response regulator FixJ
MPRSEEVRHRKRSVNVRALVTSQNSRVGAIVWNAIRHRRSMCTNLIDVTEPLWMDTFSSCTV